MSGSLVTPDQRSVTEQLKDLIVLANQHGLYDAADWVKTQLESVSQVVESRTKSLT